MKQTIGLIDISTILHPIRLSKQDKKFGCSIISQVEFLKKTLGLDLVVLVQDYGKSRYRLDLYPEYKGHRAKKELTPEEESKLELMKYWNMNLDKFPFLWKTSKIFEVEADDIIGMLYNDLSEQFEVVVCTTDKDLQNVIPHTNLYNISKERYFNLEDRKGLDRNRFIIFQTIAGDLVDNIPRFAGEKTAIVLANNFSSFKDMRNYNGDINILKGVTPYNKRYVEKFIQDIKKLEVWNGLKENYKLVNIFKDISNLNEDELKEYTKLLTDIKENNLPDFEISNELEDFLESVNEDELLLILEDLC